MGKGDIKIFLRFPINEFWKNIGLLVSAPSFGLGGSRLWENKEETKTRKKMRICSIRLKVDLYDVCVYSISLFCYLFYYNYTNTQFLRHICGIYHTRDKDSRKH